MNVFTYIRDQSRSLFSSTINRSGFGNSSPIVSDENIEVVVDGQPDQNATEGGIDMTICSTTDGYIDARNRNGHPMSNHRNVTTRRRSDTVIPDQTSDEDTLV